LEAEKYRQQLEDRRAAAIEYARQIHDRLLHSISSSKEYGVMGLRSLFLLNGGAIIAILTLIGTVLDEGQSNARLTPASFVPAFQAFGMGLVFAVIAMLCGYFNFQFHGQIYAGPAELAQNIIKLETWPSDYTEQKGRWISWTLWIAVVCGVLSLAAFFVGGVCVRSVFLST
jgi:hypothetical protein